METVFEELKRYVLWEPADETALRGLHPLALPELERIADVFYERILEHEGARQALAGGESQIGRLKITLKQWLESLLLGPWDEGYFEQRARIGRRHVHIALPERYMFGAMNVIRRELSSLIEGLYGERPDARRAALAAAGKILDLELAIMLHTYREDLIAQNARSERLATFGQLVGSIGHELRNPLAVIESSLYILRGRALDERGQKHVDRIGGQLIIANQIISDLLDMIRDRPLELGPVRPSALLDDVLTAILPPAGVRILVDSLDELPEISADASKLRQVLVNLIDNAIDAVGAAGEVRVRGWLDGAELVFAVEDSGPGVDPAIRKRLFEPLITTKAKGIGLGLPLVRRVVERHGGTVSYEPPEGGGARFVVRLPLGGTHA